MCKAAHRTQGNNDRHGSGGGMLARMRYLKDRMPSYSSGSESGAGDESSPLPLAPLLWMLTADVLTEACCFLDAKSLVTASTVCLGMRDVCQGLYPWRLLCSREWDLQEHTCDKDGQRYRVHFRDVITRSDFRKLLPLIEEMPRGFDCSLLRSPRESADRADNHGQGNNDNANDAVVPRQEGARADGDNQSVSRGVSGTVEGDNEAVTWEEDVGGFWVKRIRTPSAREARDGASRDCALAVEVEYHGGLGLGNRCVRADIPLPSTVLRERKGLGAKSHLARHLATSPLALFRWLLAKMAATATGTGARGTVSSFARAASAQNLFYDNGGATVEGGGSAGHGDDDDDDEVFSNERMQRSTSAPNGVHQQGHEHQPLPRPFCFPVSLDGGVVDVTPRLVSYFEVTIGCPRSDPPHTIPDCVAVGLSEARFPLKGKMPGWDSASYGYHSDDGGAFHDAGSMLFNCGPSFGAGDVVGCGLDYSVGDDSADIFFTLNGRSLGAAFHGVRGTFYPTVGVDSACPVRINLGREPFVFDLAAALREGGQEAAAREALAQSDSAGPAKTANLASGPSSCTAERSRQHSVPLTAIFRPFGGSAASYMAPTY